jgi:DNA-binding NarL/FixJ family response regulator
MAETPISVLLVDKEKLVRLGLVALLSKFDRFVVVGEASSASEAVAGVRRWQPDVVVMDVRLPDGSGIDACREIRAERPHTQVVFLTAYPDEDDVMAAIMAGAAGYLLKQSDPERLIEAIDVVARGESLLDSAVTRAALARIQRLGGGVDADPLAALTDHERSILPLIAEGKTNREIAAQLNLSEQTVKGYVSSILRKLKLSRRAEAAAFFGRRATRPETPAPRTGPDGEGTRRSAG